MGEDLIPRTPEAEKAHREYLKRCQVALRAINSVCDTCSARMVCGGANTELISPDDLEKLREKGIHAIAVVYACMHWKS